jgi:RNA polymerase sigma factor (sigma-70 family)
MCAPYDNTNLNLIETQWSLVLRAQPELGDAAARARKQVMERYIGAVEHYLLRVTRDPHLAADLTQEFAVRFLEGAFRGVDPRRGRFRDYVKKTVMNLVIDAHRRHRSRPESLSEGQLEVSAPALDLNQYDRQFLDCWRDVLLGRAWERLAEYQEMIGQPFHTVLRLKADQPDLHSPELADRLSTQLDRPVSAGWVRQVLHRAREKFVEYVRSEVAHSLGHPSVEELDEEMRNLGLWVYCKARTAPRTLRGPDRPQRHDEAAAGHSESIG